MALRHPTKGRSTEMNIASKLIAVAFVAMPVAGLAQSTASEVQRNINQQQRIEQGLKSGELTTTEASRLEREQSQVNRMESRALKDGTLSDTEKARIKGAQDRVSRDIYTQKHDAQKGDPTSASSQRMQADVQRNINQQKRIEQGVRSGELTNREAAKLEHGQARTERREAHAGRDGFVSQGEQQRVHSAENHQ